MIHKDVAEICVASLAGAYYLDILTKKVFKNVRTFHVKYKIEAIEELKREGKWVERQSERKVKQILPYGNDLYINRQQWYFNALISK